MDNPVSNKKTYIWSLPIRFSHWLLAICFATAYIIGDEDNFKNYHIAFGLVVGVLIIFRIIYGFTNSKYSRFKDFPVSPKSIINFLKNFFYFINVYAGHNPLAAIVMLSIFIVGLISCISGYLCYTTVNENAEEIHEIAVNIFLALVVFHLLGIIGDKITHGKTGTLKSIFTGYKNIETEPTTTSTFQKVFSVFWLLIPIITFIYALNSSFFSNSNEKNNTEEFEKNDSYNTEIEDNDDDEDDD